jgi:tRNA-Thr(GGU) m(6)t(6)A37 methyltransferase TsaA
MSGAEVSMMSERETSGRLGSGSAAGGTSPDEIWLAATWPFIRGQLPPPPARVAELGCGPAGGHLPALLRAGYDATGVDPEAPEGSSYRRVAFEDYRPGSPVDAVIASVSLHHVDDPGAVLDHVSEVLGPSGALVVIEWASEEFDEATARWCFGHQLRDPDEHGAWLGGLRAEWAASALSWAVFWRGWLEHHGLHAAAAIRREIDDRFATTHESRGPYYFPELAEMSALAEQAAIDAGELRAGCLRYAGRRASRASANTAWSAADTGESLPRYEVAPIGWVSSPLVERAQAPRQGDEGAPPAWLAFEPHMAEGLRDLRVGDHIIVVSWLDRARRDVLTTHPRNDPDSPLQGVFSTRSPDRPNPIGLHRVQILAVEGLRVLVSDLEALDRTPILDVKPVLDPIADR